VTSSTDLPAAADVLTRAADLIEKQPIGAFAAAMECAANYQRGDGTDHAYSMATHLLEFARRLLREEEAP
jgi:hypothetical protein